MSYRIVLTLALLVSGIATAEAAEMDLARVEGIIPYDYIAYRVGAPLDIDGRLDEPSWQRAPWTDYFADIEGRDRTTPRFKTRAKMLWDDQYFYVAADLEEPHVWATLTERDAVIYHDNDFEVFIDPDGDTHQYYEFEINAHGTEWDLLLIKPYRDGGPYMNAWQINGLKTAVQVWGTINQPGDIDQGWSVELAFPWEVLKECARGMAIPPEDADQWRVNFSRVEWEVDVESEAYQKVPGRSEDNWVWSPQGLINMHFPEQWGSVQFSTAIAGQGDAVFAPPPEMEAKRVLRSIYYRQHRYRRLHGHFIASLDSLGVENPVLRNYLWPPQLNVTPRLFEASLEEVIDHDEDGAISHWVVREDSRVWKD
jgi:hypothetical protein